jgi:undecaprenyl-diphosphatase
MEFLGEYGVIGILLLLWLFVWWRARGRTGSTQAMAMLAWGPVAVLIGEAVNIPLRNWIDRPRPFLSHEGLTVLVPDKTDPSFVSDHSMVVMALAVGLFLIDRRIGVIAVITALFQGFGRLYVGVHYPTDVLGGYALGAFVVLALFPLAMMALIPLVRLLERSPLRPLVTSAPRSADAFAGLAQAPAQAPAPVVPPAPAAAPYAGGPVDHPAVHTPAAGTEQETYRPFSGPVIGPSARQNPPWTPDQQ